MLLNEKWYNSTTRLNAWSWDGRNRISEYLDQNVQKNLDYICRFTQTGSNEHSRFRIGQPLAKMRPFKNRPKIQLYKFLLMDQFNRVSMPFSCLLKIDADSKEKKNFQIGQNLVKIFVKKIEILIKKNRPYTYTELQLRQVRLLSS